MRLSHEDGSFCQGRFVTEDLILQLPDAPVLERHLLFQATDLFALCVVGSPQLGALDWRVVDVHILAGRHERRAHASMQSGALSFVETVA